MILGIELTSETTCEESASAEGQVPDLVQGVRVAYTTPDVQKYTQVRVCVRVAYTTPVAQKDAQVGVKCEGFLYYP